MRKKKTKKRLSLKKATVRKLTTKDLVNVQGGMAEGGTNYTNTCDCATGTCACQGYTGLCAYTGKCVQP